MTIEETQKLLACVAAAFPGWKIQDENLTIKMWFQLLQEYRYTDLSNALRAYIMTDTSGFAPTIGQLVDKLTSYKASDEINEAEAWTIVYKAICKSGYNSKEEFAKLPPILQRAVGSAEQLKAWALDSDFNAAVESSNFKRVYRITIQRQQEEAKISPVLLAKLKDCKLLTGGNT